MAVKFCRIEGNLEVIDLESGRKWFASFEENKAPLEIDADEEYIPAAIARFAFAPVHFNGDDDD